MQEALGYFAVSAFAFLVDITILWILVHYFFWWYLAAATVSFLAGLLVAYAFSITLVFKYRRLGYTAPRICQRLRRSASWASRSMPPPWPSGSTIWDFTFL